MLRFVSLLAGVLLVSSACLGANPKPPGQATTAASDRLLLVASPTATTEPQPSPVAKASTARQQLNAVKVEVDVNRQVHPISPLIYGLSGGEGTVVKEIRPTLMSWGGNPSTRYNWQIGHAWNAGRDWYYRNGNYGHETGSASDEFVAGALAEGTAVRLAVPTLGWVAKNDDQDTCSFPLPDGTCGDGGGAKCDDPKEIADPRRANVATDPQFVADWLRHLYQDKGFDIRFLAMDNEPELWGHTHYDVHPHCTTYDEILEQYLTYATTARAVAPQAELTGPVTCCWWFYWNSAAGSEDKAKHGNQDFLPWFLDQVKQHDEKAGVRTLDVLDLHYYPEGLYNSQADEQTAAHRLQSTRSLWDRSYVDPSWIGEPIYLIPRMKQLIEEHYPGTKLGLSEWNWGADDTLHGALAIADVLGIFGREDLYFAAYWRAPEPGTPGVYGFKMFTNFDGQGSRFGDTSVWARSSDGAVVSSYAAVDSGSGNVHLMLINKSRSLAAGVHVQVDSFAPGPTGMRYVYSGANLHNIEADTFTAAGEQFDLTLAPHSLTLLVMEQS